ncbi:hypothetical protein EBZ37_13340 [bacterium]|nr:hypothetical protein [bacterium]
MRIVLLLVGVMFVAEAAHAGRTCEATYAYGNYRSSWHNLGDVSWPELKNKCKRKAEGRGDLALAALKAAIGATPPVSGCGSMVSVYFDTKVEGRTNSKDGNVAVRQGNPVPAVYSCPAGFSLSGSNCIKTQPATLVKPAGCSW